MAINSLFSEARERYSILPAWMLGSKGVLDFGEHTSDSMWVANKGLQIQRRHGQLESHK